MKLSSAVQFRAGPLFHTVQGDFFLSDSLGLYLLSSDASGVIAPDQTTSSQISIETIKRYLLLKHQEESSWPFHLMEKNEQAKTHLHEAIQLANHNILARSKQDNIHYLYSNLAAIFLAG